MMNTTERLAKIMQALSKNQGKTMLASMSEWQPWKVVISTILSARSRDETTLPICIELFKKYPTPQALAAANRLEIERLIKKTGFYKNKAVFIMESSRMISEDFSGNVPNTREELMKLPGVGRKVANCVLVYSFGVPAIPVDTHVHRISNRLGVVKTKTPEETEHKIMKLLPQKYWVKYNDALVWHGKTICKPIGPQCRTCPISQYCDKKGVDKKYYT